MRTLLGISVAAVIAAFVWSNLPTQAKQQIDGVSIDPLTMTGSVTNLLPEVHYDHGFVRRHEKCHDDPEYAHLPRLNVHAGNEGAESQQKKNSKTGCISIHHVLHAG